MNYCSHCGHSLTQRIPDGDHLPRFVCDRCDIIHYQNPNNVTGCLLEWQGKILLCKRAIEPRYGLWTLPAGFMENAETAAQGAAREAYEEAFAEAENLKLYTLFSLPHISQVYILFQGQLKNGAAKAGSESLEVKLFSEEEIPWDELAFPVITETLKLYFQDRKQGEFPTHSGHIIRDEEQNLQIVHD